jgi:hypothetical protein
VGLGMCGVVCVARRANRTVLRPDWFHICIWNMMRAHRVHSYIPSTTQIGTELGFGVLGRTEHAQSPPWTRTTVVVRLMTKEEAAQPDKLAGAHGTHRLRTGALYVQASRFSRHTLHDWCPPLEADWMSSHFIRRLFTSQYWARRWVEHGLTVGIPRCVNVVNR